MSAYDLLCRVENSCPCEPMLDAIHCSINRMRYSPCTQVLAHIHRCTLTDIQLFIACMEELAYISLLYQLVWLITGGGGRGKRLWEIPMLTYMLFLDFPGCPSHTLPPVYMDVPTLIVVIKSLTWLISRTSWKNFSRKHAWGGSLAWGFE